jgi:hypothetical protein
MAKQKKMEVNGLIIHYQTIDKKDYICLTDLARLKTNEPSRIIERWIRTRNTIDYMATWEMLYNPNFDDSLLNQLRLESSTNTFMLSAKQWAEELNAIGIFSKSGNNGGTYAHKDIAFKFASWLSVEFELYVIREFQKLKSEEQKQINWQEKKIVFKN